MIALNQSLSEGQAAFALMLEDHAPYLLPLWDFEKREYKPQLVERWLACASHGEQIMARFFLGVWRHDNQFGFDFVEAVQVLDRGQVKAITDWMNNPVWP